MLRTTRITMETETVTVVRDPGTATARCPACGTEVQVLTLDDHSLTGQVQEWLIAGKLHLWQPPGGPPLTCLPSLLSCFAQERIPKSQIAKESA